MIRYLLLESRNYGGIDVQKIISIHHYFQSTSTPSSQNGPMLCYVGYQYSRTIQAMMLSITWIMLSRKLGIGTEIKL